MNQNYDVFISYSYEDKLVAETIVSNLESKGIKCWIAPRNIIPGLSWAEAIVKGIDSSKIMVLIFSSNVLNSDFVKNELNLASNKKMPIIPFRIEDILPEDDFKFYLSRKHWLDALTPDLNSHTQELARIITDLIVSNDLWDNSSNKTTANTEDNNINESKTLAQKKDTNGEASITKQTTTSVEKTITPKNSFNYFLIISRTIGLVGLSAIIYQIYHGYKHNYKPIKSEIQKSEQKKRVYSKDEIKQLVIKVIKNGSSGHNYPFGAMPPGLVTGKDVEKVATYVANGFKGEAPAAWATCAGCHGIDGKSFGSSSPDLTDDKWDNLAKGLVNFNATPSSQTEKGNNGFEKIYIPGFDL